MERKPVAFLSYSHFDEEYDKEYLTQFRQRLEGVVRQYTGEPFEIFQDLKDIGWGQNWEERLQGAIDAVTFLIPILSPNLFKSDYCRKEVERFLNREKALRRNDLILPVYYIDTPLVDDAAKRASDPLAGAIAAHQYVDWRELRFKALETEEVRQALARLARQVRDALDRVEEVRTGAPPPSTEGDIAQRRLDLEGCDITSRSRACVAIHGGADPRVRRNRIHDGRHSGVFVYEQGRGTLEDNDIFGNAYAGVQVREGGHPIMRNNRITRNGFEAVWVHDGGGGIIGDNNLQHNKRGAWDVSKDSEANLQRNRNQE